jgi:hypothetical protein
MARVPFLCPVCQGRAVVPAGFYQGWQQGVTTDASDQPCRSCTGGIIWGDSHDEGVRVPTRMVSVDTELRGGMLCPCCNHMS